MTPTQKPPTAEEMQAAREALRDSTAAIKASAAWSADARDNLARCRGEHDGYVNSNLANRYRYAIQRLGGTE